MGSVEVLKVSSKLLWLALALALVVPLQACGDDGGDGGEPAIELCDDGEDNDGDELTDCDDTDCDDDAACQDDVNNTPAPEVCDDGEDNDDDGDTDCDDTDCDDDAACQDDVNNTPAPEVCDDGEDNDGDDATDCDDTDCADDPACDEPTPEVCDDGEDNDGDELTDCDDTDCDDDPACDEPTPEVCDDGEDNDGDDATDCDDTDCADDTDCQVLACATTCNDIAACEELIEACGQENVDAANAQCQTLCETDEDARAAIIAAGALECADVVATALELFNLQDVCVVPDPEICDDEQDNDGDELTDCDDPDCSEDEACLTPDPEVCDDEQDNDGDELTDCDDPDCTDAPNCLAPDREICDDEQDNDGDDLIDCDDPDCLDNDACIVPDPEVCDDNEDNDGDDLIDCDDPDCLDNDACVVPDPEVCDDNEDNDGDDLIDCADPDCLEDDACLIPDPEICDDNQDNDGDDLADCDDPDCTDDPSCVIAPIASGDIIFSEILYDPQDPLSEDSAEWVELFNTTQDDINLRNCTLSDANNNTTTLGSLTVPAQSFALLARSDDPLANGGLTVDGTFDFTLNNGGDTVTLTCAGDVIDTVEYDDGGTFPDARAASIQLNADLLDAFSNDDGANWCIGQTAYFDQGLITEHLGSPGLPNEVCVFEPDLCIIEDVIIAPGTFTGTTLNAPNNFSSPFCEAGDGPEVIYELEVFENTTVCIDTIGSTFDTALYVQTAPCGEGTELICNDDIEEEILESEVEFQAQAGDTFFVFVDGFDEIEAGDYILNVNFGPCGQQDFELNCNDLIDDDGDDLVDCDDPDCAADEACFVLPDPEICDDLIDNDGDLLEDCDDPDCSQDPACALPPVAVGAVIVTEILYDPQDPLSEDSAEWIELFNTTQEDINLRDCTLSDAGDNTTTLGELTVPSLGFALLARSDDPLANGGLTVDGTFSFALNNGGDTVTLTCAGDVIDTVSYDDGGTFPDARAASIQLNADLLDSVSNDNGANWCLSTNAYFDQDLATEHLGSPNAPNDACVNVAPSFSLEEVQALMNRNCTGCHGGLGGVSLGNLAGEDFDTWQGNAGIQLIVPGDADNSYLFAKINGTQAQLGGFGSRMPQGGPFWSDDEIAGFRGFIDNLAP